MRGRAVAAALQTGQARYKTLAARRAAAAAYGAGYMPPMGAMPKFIPKPKPNAFLKQVKALVAGKRKDATDVNRDTADQSSTTISCLTSSTDFATAASGTGLLDMDGDQALINGLTLNQSLALTCLEDLTPVGLGSAFVRTLIVYFKKPLLVASAAGTLPPITEVLVADSVASLFVPDTQNAGRFVVIYDKTDNLGTNTVSAAASGANPRVNGTNALIRRIYVKIDKNCHFKVAGVSGTPSGHYDSDVQPGQVDAGLLIMYTQVTNGATAGTITVLNRTRLNYTG